jgi:hypothetical protein
MVGEDVRRRWPVYLIVVWGCVVMAAPPADGAPLPPAGAAAAADLDGVRAVLEGRLVRQRLAALGVAPGEATAILERLSPEERAQLAARAEELAVGGDSGVALLAFAIIVALLTVLLLELLGHRVVSRP